MIKDSGKRQQFDSGMVRDITEDKIDYTLAMDGPLFKRLAIHLTEGAKKYDKRNWMKASGRAEYDRFKESLIRHLIQYFDGETDEDHFAAAVFNLNGMEYVREKLKCSCLPGEICMKCAPEMVKMLNSIYPEHARIGNRRK